MSYMYGVCIATSDHLHVYVDGCQLVLMAAGGDITTFCIICISWSQNLINSYQK